MHRYKHEEILQERLRREVADLSKSFAVGVKFNERDKGDSETSQLAEYRSRQKKAPSDKRIIHDLINIEFPLDNLLLKYHTDYSTIEIRYLKDAELTLYVMSFKDMETEEVLKLGFLTTYNLVTATGTNINAKQPAAIHNLNFILCEILELVAKIECETNLFMVGTDS